MPCRGADVSAEAGDRAVRASGSIRYVHFRDDTGLVWRLSGDLGDLEVAKVLLLAFAGIATDHAILVPVVVL